MTVGGFYVRAEILYMNKKKICDELLYILNIVLHED